MKVGFIQEDSILLSSKKSISLSSNEDIGLSTSGSMSIESGELKLGSSTAEQPVIMGETFLNELNGILTSLKNVMDSLKSEPSLKITPASATILSKQVKSLRV